MDYLEVEDDGMREIKVELVRRLFGSSSGDYCRLYGQHFKTLIKRFHDRSPSVRILMVDFGKIILSRSSSSSSSSPSSSSSSSSSSSASSSSSGSEGSGCNAEQVAMVCDALCGRLSDKDDTVRQRAVYDVCDLAFASLHAVPLALLQAVGNRYADKKPEIRKAAITGLSRIYSEHMGKAWKESVPVKESSNGGDDDGEEDGFDDEGEEEEEEACWAEVPESVAEKLNFVPAMVLYFACSKHNSPQVKLRACQLFDDYIIPKALHPKVRAAGMLYVFGQLSPSGKQALEWFLVNRSLKQANLATFVHLMRTRSAAGASASASSRSSSSSASSSSEPDAAQALEQAEAQLAAHYAAMLPSFPTPDKKVALLSKLAATKDKKVLRALDVLSSPAATAAQVASARDALPKALGSKSPLGEYAKDVARASGMGCLGSDMIKAILSLCGQAAQAAAAAASDRNGRGKSGNGGRNRGPSYHVAAHHAALGMGLLECAVRAFPRLVHAVLGDLLELYGDLDQVHQSSQNASSIAKQSNSSSGDGQQPNQSAQLAFELRLRLLQVLEAAGQEVSQAAAGGGGDAYMLDASVADTPSSQSQSQLSQQPFVAPVAAPDPMAAADFADELERLCTRDGSADQAKLAVRVMAALLPAAAAAVPPKTSSSPNSPTGSGSSSNGGGVNVSVSPQRKGEKRSDFEKRRASATAAAESARAARASVGAATAARVVKALCSSRSLAYDSKRLVTCLKGLREAAKRFPAAFQPHAGAVKAFVLAHVVHAQAPAFKHSPNSKASAAAAERRAAARRKSRASALEGAGEGSSSWESSGGLGGEPPELSEDAGRLCAGLKLLAVVGATTGAAGHGNSQSDDDDENDDDEGEGSMGSLLEVLFQVLECRDLPGGRQVSQFSTAELAQLRRVASVAVLDLVQRCGEQALACLPPPRWHTLAWCMQDASPRVRCKFVAVVCRGVRACSLPLRFMPYLSLAVGDPDLSVKKACADALLAAVHRLRGEHLKRMSVLADAAALLNNSDGSGSGSGSGRSGGGGGNMDASLALDATLNGSMMTMDRDCHHPRKNGRMSDEAIALETQRRCLNTTLMPEYAVPYAIHLLTYHPDFPEDSSDTQRVKTVERHLKALLEPLIVSLGAEADNVSFLLQMFDMVMQHEDALDGEADRVLLLCSVGKKCLKKMIKNPENVKPYPGHIYLPVALYRQRGPSKSTPASIDGGDDENVASGNSNSKRSKKAATTTAAVAKQTASRKSSSSATTNNKARKHVGESWEASTLLPLDSPSAAHSPFEEPSWGSPIAPASATTVVSRATAKTKGGRRNSSANTSSSGNKRKKSGAKNSSKRASVSDSDLSSSDESDQSNHQSSNGRKRNSSRAYANSDDDNDDDEGPPEMEELLDVRPASYNKSLSSPNASRRAPPRAAAASMEYLVKWSGRGVASSTWEPAASVTDRTLVADFERRNRQINDAAAASTATRGLGSSDEAESDEDKDDEEGDSQAASVKSSPSGRKRGASSSTISSGGRRVAATATTSRNNKSQANQKTKGQQSPAKGTSSSSKAAKVVEPETAGASMLSDDDDGETSSSAVSQGMSQDLGVDENAPPKAAAKAARSTNTSNQKGLSVSNSASANRKSSNKSSSPSKSSPSSVNKRGGLTSKAAVAAAQAPAAHSSGTKRRTNASATTFSSSPQVVKALTPEAAVSESEEEEIVTLSRRRRRPAAASAN